MVTTRNKEAMQITVKFSSIFKAISGIDQVQIEISEGITVDQLSIELSKKYKNLPFESEKTYYYVNDKIAVRERILVEGDQVRILQTLAGG